MPNAIWTAVTSLKKVSLQMDQNCRVAVTICRLVLRKKCRLEMPEKCLVSGVPTRGEISFSGEAAGGDLHPGQDPHAARSNLATTDKPQAGCAPAQSSGKADRLAVEMADLPARVL